MGAAPRHTSPRRSSCDTLCIGGAETRSLPGNVSQRRISTLRIARFRDRAGNVGYGIPLDQARGRRHGPSLEAEIEAQIFCGRLDEVTLDEVNPAAPDTADSRSVFDTSRNHRAVHPMQA